MSKTKPIVLLLEDNSLLRAMIKKYLDEEKIDVLECKDIFDAKEMWGKNKSHIDAIVLDTNMSPRGLAPEEKEFAKDGIFSGWVWLVNYVLVGEDSFSIEKVFLFSEYIPNLEDYIVEKKEYKYEKFEELKRKKHLIKKGDVNNAVTILVKTLKKALD